MMILLNPLAGGATAGKKWSGIERDIRRLHGEGNVCIPDGPSAVRSLLRDALRSSETDFVAAGGDGTVNLLLNELMELSTPAQLRTLRFGAIGLGSSNDFHKPFSSRSLVRGISCKLDVVRARPRDIGFLRIIRENGSAVTRHFMANASAGLTAQANETFNHPGRVLKHLKRLHTPAAIFATALRSMATFRNIEMTACCGSLGTFAVRLTNIGLVKNPYFSGELRYGGPADYESGTLDVHLCRDMNRLDLVRLFLSLRKGLFPSWKTRSWKTARLLLTSKTPFAVEYDGETLRTTSVQFGVLQKLIRVCP